MKGNGRAYRALLSLLGVLLAFAAVPYLLSLGPASAPSSPVLAPATPAPGPSGAVALLGDGNDPACAPLYDGLEELCREEGWTFVSYDCRGRAESQTGQAEDLLRREEEVRTAVVFPVEEEPDWEEALKVKGLRTVVLGEDREARAAQAAEYFAGALPGGTVLVLPTVPEDPMEKLCREALERKGLTAVQNGYSWAVEAHTQALVEEALDRWPGLGGVLCFDETGALAAAQGVENRQAEGRVRVLCLEDSPLLRGQLDLGRVSALVASDPEATLEELKTALDPKSDAERVTLKVRIATAQSERK